MTGFTQKGLSLYEGASPITNSKHINATTDTHSIPKLYNSNTKITIQSQMKHLRHVVPIDA